MTELLPVGVKVLIVFSSFPPKLGNHEAAYYWRLIRSNCVGG